MSKLALILTFLLCAGAPARLRGQVGHDPSQTPYRDIVTRQHLTFFYGRFAGARTQPGVGALPGQFTGARLETRLSGPLDLAATFGRVSSGRYVVNPLKPPPRTSGPIDMTIVAADVALVLNLTGAKSWHRLAPYFGLGIGILAPTRTVVDTGGYRAASNFSFVPTLGTKIYLTRHLVLRAEARDYYFRYEWPLAYFSPVDPEGNAVQPPVLPISEKDRKWTHNYSLALGLTYAFTF